MRGPIHERQAGLSAMARVRGDERLQRRALRGEIAPCVRDQRRGGMYAALGVVWRDLAEVLAAQLELLVVPGAVVTDVVHCARLPDLGQREQSGIAARLGNAQQAHRRTGAAEVDRRGRRLSEVGTVPRAAA